MAYKTMLVILLLSAVVVEEASGCHNINGQMRCYYPKPASSVQIGRKMVAGSSSGTSVNGELRTVPSGPDPLHHNGATPNKPTTP